MKFIYKVTLLFSLLFIFFFLSENKIFLQFTYLDLLTLLLSISIMLYSFINLFFLKKNLSSGFIVILVFSLFLFQVLRLNNINFEALSEEQQCVLKNIEYEQNKNNSKIKEEYIKHCKKFRVIE